MAFKNFTTSNGESFGGEFLEIDKNKSITYTDRFLKGGAPSAEVKNRNAQ